MHATAGLDLGTSIGPDADVALGHTFNSPGALLGILETAYGLNAAPTTPAERVAWLTPRLAQTPGFWTRSFEADAWGTASRLIRDRDALVLAGWAGQSLSPRWDALWQVTCGIAPGMGDRWLAIAHAAGSRTIDLTDITLVDPLHEFPGAIALALNRLAAHDITIHQASSEPAAASGDLASARLDPFRPTGDGSLQLIRPQAAAAAAEDIAAYLAEHGNPATTIIVNPDATLDAALARAGLPTLGAPAAAIGARAAALQILPLIVQLLWDPADPQVALDLLSLPATPIPTRLARALARALRQWPAVGSDDWADALANHDYGTDPDAAARRRDRVRTLLTPTEPRTQEAAPIQELIRRVEASAAWVRGRAHADDATDPAWHRASTQHSTLLRLLRGHDAPSVPQPLLARWVDAATDSAGTAVPLRPAAGLRSVQHPGAVIRPTQTVIWWNFTRASAPPVRELSLTSAERAALASHEISVPTAGTRAMWAARRWRRPLLQATDTLLLVAPLSSAPGEAMHPHPLWDEITAAIPGNVRRPLSAALQCDRPGLTEAAAATRTRATRVSLPSYKAHWSVPAASLPARDKESPSGLAALVGCSFRWALQYPLKIPREHASYRLTVGPRDHGNLAHAVLAGVLTDLPPTPDAAAALAGQLFDTLGPRHVAPMFLPGHDGDREDARGKIVRSAHAVATWLAAQGLAPEVVEGALTREFEGRTIEGRVDLMAGKPRVVVDFKLGGRTMRRREIEDGTAYQLAAYAYAATTEGGEMPEYAYFVVNDQRMIGRRGGPFDPNDAVDGPPPSQTWARLLNASRHQLAEVEAGRLIAPGSLAHVPERAVVDGDRLALPPGCRYCSFDALCGRAFAEDNR